MSVRVFFTDGRDTVYYGASGAWLQGAHFIIGKAPKGVEVPPRMVAALEAKLIDRAEICDRDIVKEVVLGPRPKV